MSRIAFLGTPQVAVPALRALATEGIQAVFCNPDRPAGRGRHLEAPPVKGAALELGLPVHQPLRWRLPETQELWESLAIDLAIVVAYGHILPAWMLDSCPLGVWNLHFSLLPRWRGAAPVNHALLAGDEATGVSLMRLTPGLDEGPVLAQCQRNIGHGDTAEDLLAALAVDAADLLMDQLPLLLSGTARPQEQDHALATLAPKLNREMGRLDWQRPAADLHRQVRALWPCLAPSCSWRARPSRSVAWAPCGPATATLASCSGARKAPGSPPAKGPWSSPTCSGPASPSSPPCKPSSPGAPAASAAWGESWSSSKKNGLGALVAIFCLPLIAVCFDAGRC